MRLLGTNRGDSRFTLGSGVRRQGQVEYGEHAAENVKSELRHATACVSIVGGPAKRVVRLDQR